MSEPIDIQIERSLVNTPTNLLFGEPAWDDTNKHFYVGDSTGTPILINNANLSDRFLFLACRNANLTTDQALRRQNGTFINVTPYIVPYNGIIYAITAENQNINVTRTWDFVVEVNNVVVQTLTVPSTDHKAVINNLNLAVSQGDEVVMFFRNASNVINRPGGVVYGRRI